MDYILETERLSLRGFTLRDTAFIIELLNSPGWLKFIGDRNIKTEEQATTYLQNGPLKSYAENGYGLWMVETKDDKIPLGMCGILNRALLERPDIGFAFLPQFTGKGYAFEIATATVAYAKNQLNMAQLCAITLPHNTASISLLKKIGFKPVGIFRFPNSEEDLMLYRG